MTTFELMQQTLAKLRAVHGWDGMFNIWIDRYGIQRIRLEYALETDTDDSPDRVHHYKERVGGEPWQNLEELIAQFCKECVEGL